MFPSFSLSLSISLQVFNIFFSLPFLSFHISIFPVYPLLFLNYLSSFLFLLFLPSFLPSFSCLPSPFLSHLPSSLRCMRRQVNKIYYWKKCCLSTYSPMCVCVCVCVCVCALSSFLLSRLYIFFSILPTLLPSFSCFLNISFLVCFLSFHFLPLFFLTSSLMLFYIHSFSFLSFFSLASLNLNFIAFNFTHFFSSFLRL